MLVFTSPLFYLTKAPKHKGSDAGNLEMPERAESVSLMWKGESSPRSKKIKNNCMLRLLRSMVLANSSMKLLRRKKKFMLVLLSHLELQT